MDARFASSIFSKASMDCFAMGDDRGLSALKKDYLKTSRSISRAETLRLAYLRLSSEYRSEYIIKNEIAKSLFVSCHDSDDATLINEMRAGRSKADSVIFNGASTCYEIKSKYDSPKRLRTQIEDYSKVFDSVYVVYDPEIEDTILRNTPASTGLIRIQPDRSLIKLREPKKTEKDAILMLDSLRMDEKLYICERLGRRPANETPNTQIAKLVRETIGKCDTDLFNHLYVEAIKKFRATQKIWLKRLPASLTAAATTYSFSEAQRKEILEFFK